MTHKWKSDRLEMVWMLGLVGTTVGGSDGDGGAWDWTVVFEDVI